MVTNPVLGSPDDVIYVTMHVGTGIENQWIEVGWAKTGASYGGGQNVFSVGPTVGGLAFPQYYIYPGLGIATKIERTGKNG
jgi:hypothetical protein